MPDPSLVTRRLVQHMVLCHTVSLRTTAGCGPNFTCSHKPRKMNIRKGSSCILCSRFRFDSCDQSTIDRMYFLRHITTWLRLLQGCRAASILSVFCGAARSQLSMKTFNSCIDTGSAAIGGPNISAGVATKTCRCCSGSDDLKSRPVTCTCNTADAASVFSLSPIQTLPRKGIRYTPRCSSNSLTSSWRRSFFLASLLVLCWWVPAQGQPSASRVVTEDPTSSPTARVASGPPSEPTDPTLISAGYSFEMTITFNKPQPLPPVVTAKPKPQQQMLKTDADYHSFRYIYSLHIPPCSATHP